MDPSRTRASWLTCTAIRSAAVVMAMAMGTMCVGAAQERPAYRAQRFEEDWSFLRDPARHDDPWDGWKYLPLPWHGWYVTVAGEERLRYERLDHPGFGTGPADTNGYLLHRALLSADVHLGRRVRVFAEVQSGLATGRAGEYNGLLVQPVTTEAGVFDNGTAAGQSLWGVGVISAHPWWRRARWSAYYLGLDRRRASFVQGTGAERRHTVGTRTWRATSRWDINGEAIVQWGRFAGAPIRAWALSGDLGTTLRHRWRPRLGVRADVASGDRDATDARLESFNPLFPSATAYSGSSGVIGASNITDVTPTVRVAPTTALTLTVEAAVYRRQQLGDGIYTVFVTPLRPPGPSPSRAIGVAPSASVTVQVDRHLTWTTAASLFVPGTYPDSVPPARPVQYATTVLTYRF